jgi:hypothetical protein
MKRAAPIGGTDDNLSAAPGGGISPTDAAIFSQRPAGTFELELPNIAATSR